MVQSAERGDVPGEAKLRGHSAAFCGHHASHTQPAID